LLSFSSPVRQYRPDRGAVKCRRPAEIEEVGAVIEHEVPDIYGRPWAAIREEDHERGMARPERAGLFDFE